MGTTNATRRALHNERYSSSFAQRTLPMASEATIQAFIEEQSLADKPVTGLPGIGERLGGRLEENGFDRAYQVLGMFLSLKCDEDSFKEWLNAKCNANSAQQQGCYLGVQGYARSHL